MILVIDVGNTRLKWAWLTSTGLSDQQAVVHRDAKPGMWTAALFESGQKPKRVLIANVAGPVMAKTLAKMTKKVFKVTAEFVTAPPEFHGLVNGYLDPKLLGAPSDHMVNVREVRLAAGAEFIVMICGDIMTMPGLPKVPAADSIDIDENGKVVGLF